MLLLLLAFNFNSFSQGIKIGEDGNPAHLSAILEIDSEDKGLLMPRLTTAQRGNINNPQPGLQIYNTDTDCVQVYFATGGWQNMQCGCTTFPDATFTFNNGSVNSPVNFSANGTGTGYTYEWTFPSGTPSTSTQQNPTVEWSSAGTYTVELTVTDGDGCSSTETAQVEIASCTPETNTYNFTGNVQTYTVPPGVNLIEVELWGAQGGTADSPGNNVNAGGYASGELAVNPGDVLHIYVGEQPSGDQGSWNGGGDGNTDSNTGAGGGGASDIRLNGTALTNRVIVAGGGGGHASNDGFGGEGGGLQGGDWSGWGAGGFGGTQIAGGAGGGSSGQDGALGVGGDSGTTGSAGAGGGGGYYGGGGSGQRRGAGGGSGYIGGVNNGDLQGGQNTGNGQVIITTVCP